MCAEENKNKILDEIAGIECAKRWTHLGKLWQLRKKLFPKSRDPPTAMLDPDGNLVTCENIVEEITLDAYKNRLKNRPMKDSLSNLKTLKENLCNLRLELAKRNKSPDWTMEQLETVLDYLKKNKSRDPLGYANDIFKKDVAGEDLKKAIIILMNRIKKELLYPEALELYDISSIYKNKGARSSFENYRGIFQYLDLYWTD